MSRKRPNKNKTSGSNRRSKKGSKIRASSDKRSNSGKVNKPKKIKNPFKENEAYQEYSKQRTEIRNAVNEVFGLRAPKKPTGRKSSVKLTKLPDEFMFNGRSNFSPLAIKRAYEGNIKAMHQEYSRLRPTVMKRLTRLEHSKFAGSEMFKYYKDSFQKLKYMEDKDLPEALTLINRFLDNPLSTIRGQTKLRNERIETLQNYGYAVDETNFDKVVDVMDKLRDMIKNNMYDSDQTLKETIDEVNRIINDPSMNLEDRSSIEIAQEVYDKYASSSSELLSLF